MKFSYSRLSAVYFPILRNLRRKRAVSSTTRIICINLITAFQDALCSWARPQSSLGKMRNAALNCIKAVSLYKMITKTEARMIKLYYNANKGE